MQYKVTNYQKTVQYSVIQNNTNLFCITLYGTVFLIVCDFVLHYIYRV